MNYAPVLISCIIFIELFFQLKTLKHINSLVETSKQAANAIMSPQLDDDKKEAIARQASLNISKELVFFLIKFSIIAGTLYSFYLLSIEFLPDSQEGFLNSFQSPLVIFILTITSISYILIRNVIRRKL